MNVTVRQAPPHHFSFLYGRIGLHITSGFCAMEAIDETEKIHGMVGFDNWTENAADMHVVLDTFRGTRALLKPCFRFLFCAQGRNLAHAHVRSDNAKSLRLVKTAGFKEVYRARDWHRVGVDDVVFEMRREDCAHLS